MKEIEAQGEKVTITFQHENGETLKLLFTRKEDWDAYITIPRGESDDLSKVNPLLRILFAAVVDTLTEESEW